VVRRGWPLDAKGWESEKMNEMVFQLQPEIIVNNRNKLDGDFATPEQRIQAEAKRAWESCMTMNDSWGYQRPTTTGNRPRPLCATWSPARTAPATTC
jgi:alpha-L-fucosidase